MFGTKVYNYNHGLIKNIYYITLNGYQILGPYFSENKVNEAIQLLMDGKKLDG